jgi:alcohol dehydrogenase class IV
MINHPKINFFEEGEKPNQQIVFGNNTSNYVGHLAERLGSHVLLVTDPGLSSAGHSEHIKKNLEAKSLSF